MLLNHIQEETGYIHACSLSRWRQDKSMLLIQFETGYFIILIQVETKCMQALDAGGDRIYSCS